eukprot:g53405.t1
MRFNAIVCSSAGGVASRRGGPAPVAKRKACQGSLAQLSNMPYLQRMQTRVGTVLSFTTCTLPAAEYLDMT